MTCTFLLSVVAVILIDLVTALRLQPAPNLGKKSFDPESEVKHGFSGGLNLEGFQLSKIREPRQVPQLQMHKSAWIPSSEIPAKTSFAINGHGEAGHDCTSLEGVQREFCESMIGKSLASGFSAYQQERARCRWDVTPNFSMRYWRFSTSEEFYSDSRTHLDLMRAVNGSDAMFIAQDQTQDLHRCNFVVPEGHWYVERVGPFYFESNSDWVNIWFQAFKNTSLEGFLSGSLLSVTDAEGNIIPYPPVHMHHFHLHHSEMTPWGEESMLHFLFTDTHGDMACLDRSLGAKCYMQLFPEKQGIAQINSRGFFFDSLANLVGSWNKPFFFDVSVLCRKQVRHLISYYNLQLPLMDPWSYADALTYDLPPGDHVAWTTQTIPFDMSIDWWKWHLHADFHDDVWLYFGNPDDLGLGKEGLVQTDVPVDHQYSEEEWNMVAHPRTGLAPLAFCEKGIKARLLPLKSIGQSLTDIKRILNQRFEDNGLRWFVKLDPQALRADVVRGKMYERRPLTRILQDKLVAGTNVTTLAFLKNNLQVLARIHTIFHMIVRRS